MRLVTGNTYRHKAGRTAYMDCGFCGVKEETSIHILSDCVELSNMRRRIMRRTSLKSFDT